MTAFGLAARRFIRPFVPKFLMEPRQRQKFFGARGFRNLHWGAFDSFQDALAFAERYDAVTRFAECHEDVLRKRATLRHDDYPVLFWLARVLPTIEAGRLVDLGGSVGVSYYAYRDRLSLSDGLIWMVCELSEVVAQGQAIAAERSAPHLRFTDDFAEIDDASILFSAGCLQYLERSLSEILSGLNLLPRHIIINRMALTENDAYVTLQNTGFSISPCRVENTRHFVASLAALGYRQEDSWKCLDHSTEVPFHPECTLSHFLGFYFRLEPGSSRPAESRTR